MRSLKRPLLIFLLASLCGAAWMLGFSGCGKSVENASPQDLASRMDKADSDELGEICQALTNRGEAGLPDILQAFEKSTKPSSQIALGEAVYRMKPSAATKSALKKMHELAKDPDAREAVGRYAAGVR